MELLNREEHIQRFNELNSKRSSPLPLDEHFLLALDSGLPPCCGVAVGFDRLMMARHKTKEIADILPFSWNQA